MTWLLCGCNSHDVSVPSYKFRERKMHQISLTVYRLRVVVHGITLTMIVVQLAIQAMEW
jgi:hypothetical protein